MLQERILQSTCVKKEAVGKEILITFKNGNIQPIRIKGGPPKSNKVEPVQPNQINIYQINTYSKDLDKLHFDNESRVQYKQQVKGQQSHIPVSVPYLKHWSSNQEHKAKHDNRILCQVIWYIHRDK